MMKIKKGKPRISMGIELFYVLVIVLVCVKVSYALPEVMDIQLYDESTYLNQGNRFHPGYLFKDGFIYLAWYKLLSFFVKDTITLYYFNYIVLLCINPLLIYLLLRKTGKERFTSAVFSILFLISNVNIIANPFITRFALALILCTFILILSVKNKRTKYLIALFGVCLLVYTRPEYILSLLVFSFASMVYLLYRYSKSHKRAFLYFVSLTLVLSIFILLVKNPANPRRSVMAFGQHYGVHLYNKGKISIDPNTNWRKIMKENFQTDQSIFRASLNNPGEMANHVFANIRDIPYQAIQLFFPYHMENKLIKKIFLVIAGMLLIFLMMITIKKKKKERFLQGKHVDDDIFYSLSLLIIIPLIVSVCLVYPREHYLLVLFAIILTAAAKSVPKIPEGPKSRWFMPLIVLFIIFWVPWQAGGSYRLLPRNIMNIHHKICTNVKRIRFIRNIKVKSTIVFLGYGGSMEPYINHFQYVDKNEKNVPFNEFIQREKINMMIVDNGLLKDPRFISDDEFKDFISKIPDNNWLKMEIPHCAGYLAVKRDIL
ncbi:MAG: hypothetical protein JSV88_28610 [Candidatus Aminicenantes bacterium]|nr:MAG: hypothetical protein JSV88_28610 [Candidatus Aminicenantes bacterium]